MAVRPARRLWMKAAIVIALAAAAGGVYWAATQESGPMVLVMPMSTRDEAPAIAAFNAGLAESLTAELTRGGTRVVAWPLFVEYRRKNADASVQIAASAMKAEFVIVLSVSPQADRARIVAHIVRPGQNGKIWATDYERQLGADTLAVQRELARSMADELRSRLARIR